MLTRPAKNNNQDIANQEAECVRSTPESMHNSWILWLHARLHCVAGRVVSTTKNVTDFESRCHPLRFGTPKNYFKKVLKKKIPTMSSFFEKNVIARRKSYERVSHKCPTYKSERNIPWKIKRLQWSSKWNLYFTRWSLHLATRHHRTWKSTSSKRTYYTASSDATYTKELYETIK